MHPWPYQIIRRRMHPPGRERRGRERRGKIPALQSRPVPVLAAAEATTMVAVTPIRPRGRRPANLAEAVVDTPSHESYEPRRTALLPVHRSIIAVDIEGSTQRTNPVKQELREQVYQLVLGALGIAGIDDQYYDPFTDRGDGVLVLLRPADELPKPLLLSRLIPARPACSCRTTAASPRPSSRECSGCVPSSTRGGALRRQGLLRRGPGCRLPAARCAAVQGPPA